MTIETTAPIVIEREMAHPPEKVWRALTESSLLQEWLMENDFKPVVGNRSTFRMPSSPNWNGVTDCEVLAVEPNKRLSYTWNSSGDEAANGLKTVVEWTLTPTANGTLIRMEHSGFRPEQEFFYKGATYGWNKMLAAMEEVLQRN